MISFVIFDELAMTCHDKVVIRGCCRACARMQKLNLSLFLIHMDVWSNSTTPTPSFRPNQQFVQKHLSKNHFLASFCQKNDFVSLLCTPKLFFRCLSSTHTLTMIPPHPSLHFDPLDSRFKGILSKHHFLSHFCQKNDFVFLLCTSKVFFSLQVHQ